MSAIAKTIIQNKEWIVKKENTKIGTISKLKKGFVFYKNGNKIYFKDITELQKELGLPDFTTNSKKIKPVSVKSTDSYSIYDYPCKSKPYNPVFNLKKRLPIYTKSEKSKSHFCAGYFLINFKKGWLKSFCPKLITLERYPYHGPYKNEDDVKNLLNTFNKL